MHFSSLPIAFNWEPAFLHIVDIFLSKFSRLSISSIPSNLTECSDVIFLLSIYISCLFSNFQKSVYYHCLKLTSVYDREVILNH